jgi:regulator of nonsense transcripts 2
MHNPEILFHLVDTCGRYLMKKEKMEGFTKLSFNNMLDKLWEIRSQSILSEISIQYVENAYFYCRPSESAGLNKESELTEDEKHINYLLFEKLNDRSAEIVAKDLKSIDLKINEEFLIDSIIRLANIGTFSDLDTVCYVLNVLQQTWMKSTVTKVIKKVVKDIEVHVDDKTISGYQFRVQEVNFLSTLYYYGVIDTNNLFLILYSLIPLDHNEKKKSDVSFRIRLACTMLENLSLSGFKEGSKSEQKKIKTSLNKFLNHFYAYIFIDKKISLDLEYLVLDTYEALKPNMKNSKNIHKQFSGKHKFKKDDFGKNLMNDSDSDEEQKEVSPPKDNSAQILAMEREKEIDVEEQEFDNELKQMMDKSFAKGKHKRPLLKLDTAQMKNVMLILYGLYFKIE